MPAYTFAAYMASQITVDAADEESARKILSGAINGTEVSLGPLPSGEPLNVTLGLDGDPFLDAVDGQPADGSEPQ